VLSFPLPKTPLSDDSGIVALLRAGPQSGPAGDDGRAKSSLGQFRGRLPEQSTDCAQGRRAGRQGMTAERNHPSASFATTS
jgi:hypothetical protein